ncbi:MAG: class I SAM-dependent methyltransferase [Cyanobacteria bacterium REEB67]|nr:class I SAM-dependent methyltransferase [Cyanobacteria bacterium REEB67]
MIERHKQNPTGRFSGLAETYARCRPSYPSDAVDFIAAVAGLTPAALIVDVGCGTGISSRLFAERGYSVCGIEPNDDMRQKAEEEEEEGRRSKSIKYSAGTAEDTGIDAEAADLVLSAQAFHWFDPVKALPEFRRILKPGGWVALIWNERDESDKFTAEYGALFRTLPDTAGVEIPRGKAGNALLESNLFEHQQRDLFISSQLLDEEGLIGRAFSASYAPKHGLEKKKFEHDLRELFKVHARQSDAGAAPLVRMHYATSVYTAQRPAL